MRQMVYNEYCLVRDCSEMHRYHEYSITFTYSLQGRVKVPTGGIARKPRGMIWLDSRADSIVWMREERYL